MIMSFLLDLIDNIRDLFGNKKIVLSFLAALVCAFVLIISCANSRFHAKLFYFNVHKDKLVFENREIVNGKNRKEKIRNLLEELLLGPVDSKMDNPFASGSKLFGVEIEGDTILLDFNELTFADTSYIELAIQSIVETVCFYDPYMKKVRFFIKGEEYRYIGTVGPLDNGVAPDYKYLSK